MHSSLLLLVVAFLEFVLMKATGKQLNSEISKSSESFKCDNHFYFFFNHYRSSQRFCKYMQKVPVCSSLPGNPTGGADSFSSI